MEQQNDALAAAPVKRTITRPLLIGAVCLVVLACACCISTVCIFGILPGLMGGQSTPPPEVLLIGKWKYDAPNGGIIEFTEDKQYITYLAIPQFGSSTPNLVPISTQWYSLLDDHTMEIRDIMDPPQRVSFSIGIDKLTLTFENGSTGTYTRVR